MFHYSHVMNVPKPSFKAVSNALYMKATNMRIPKERLPAEDVRIGRCGTDAAAVSNGAQH